MSCSGLRKCLLIPATTTATTKTAATTIEDNMKIIEKLPVTVWDLKVVGFVYF